jgi:flagellar biosynthesis/type III secretory pathway M-ring protein FliF/YscJ
VPDVGQDRVTLSRGGAPAPNYEQQVAAARSLIGQDPRRAADVVKDWVTTDGR